MPERLRAGFPTYWQDIGRGPKPALFLHCALGHSSTLKGLGAELQDLVSGPAFDLPGHGRSAGWDQRCDVHEMATRMAASFLDQPRHLIGHSFGATVALRLALEQPQDILSLTLIEPVLFAAARDPEPEAFDSYLTAVQPFHDALTKGDLVTAVQEFTATWGGGAAWDDLPKRAQDTLVRQIPMIGESNGVLIQDSAQLLSPGRLEAVRCPVLLIRGAQSPDIMEAVHSALAARLPLSRTEVVAEAGHMLPISHPGEVAALVRPHLAQL